MCICEMLGTFLGVQFVVFVVFVVFATYLM